MSRERSLKRLLRTIADSEIETVQEMIILN